MPPRKLKVSEIPKARDLLLKAQARKCPLCQGTIGGSSKKPALDHCHVTGHLRDVLCLHCNGMEGKVFNLARRAKDKITPEQWVENLHKYYQRHATPRHGGLLHPTHKTEAEKRLARNKKARLKRAKLKGK